MLNFIFKLKIFFTWRLLRSPIHFSLAKKRIVLTVSGLLFATLILPNFSLTAFAQADDEAWVVVQIKQVKVLDEHWGIVEGAINDEAEFRLFVIAPNGDFETSLISPSNTTLPANVGSLVPVGNYGISIPISNATQAITISLGGVDSDKLPYFAGDAFEKLVSFVAEKALKASKGNFVAPFVGEFVGMAYEHIIQDDDIGEAILVLEREKGWQADGQVHHIQASNGTLEFVYEVRLAQRPDNLQGCALHETSLFYEVKASETLSGIAWRYQVLLSDVLAVNEINNADQIDVGQLLLIPPVACVSHIVQPGDTLSGIANQYGIPLETLQAYNLIFVQTHWV